MTKMKWKCGFCEKEHEGYSPFCFCNEECFKKFCEQNESRKNQEKIKREEEENKVRVCRDCSSEYTYSEVRKLSGGFTSLICQKCRKKYGEAQGILDMHNKIVSSK